MKILIIIVCCILVLGGILYFALGEKKQEPVSNSYQGPVPEGYNETHFRETGETILLNREVIKQNGLS